MSLKHVIVSQASSPAKDLAAGLGWPGDALDNGDGTVTLTTPESWDEEENPAKVAVSKLTGNKDVHVFASAHVAGEGEWLAVVVKGQAVLILIDPSTGEGWLTTDMPMDYTVPLSVSQPFNQRKQQTETANMKNTQVLANVGSVDEPEYLLANITGHTEEGHVTVAFTDGDVATYVGMFDPAGIQPLVTAAGVEIAGMNRTVVLANVGSHDNPNYQTATVTGTNEDGDLEVAFASGQTAVYSAHFHPAGIMPVTTETAANKAMTVEQKLKRAQTLLKLRAKHDLLESSTEALKGKRGPEATAKRAKIKADKEKLRSTLDKMGVDSLPSMSSLQRAIKTNSMGTKWKNLDASMKPAGKGTKRDKPLKQGWAKPKPAAGK